MVVLEVVLVAALDKLGVAEQVVSELIYLDIPWQVLHSQYQLHQVLIQLQLAEVELHRHQFLEEKEMILYLDQ